MPKFKRWQHSIEILSRSNAYGIGFYDYWQGISLDRELGELALGFVILYFMPEDPDVFYGG
ncbi:MAG: hypothetical protein ACYSR6_10320 [Planctomycetota bacterium]|jgi:hypothetical protein